MDERRGALLGGDRQVAIRTSQDPVLAARIAEINKRGGNAFMDYQLPRAVISLSRARSLIRDETDRGVLMICDPRLLTRPYGRRIWQSLPPMRRTRELAQVQSFFSPAISCGQQASTIL